MCSQHLVSKAVLIIVVLFAEGPKLTEYAELPEVAERECGHQPTLGAGDPCRQAVPGPSG